MNYQNYTHNPMHLQSMQHQRMHRDYQKPYIKEPINQDHSEANPFAPQDSLSEKATDYVANNPVTAMSGVLGAVILSRFLFKKTPPPQPTIHPVAKMISDLLMPTCFMMGVGGFLLRANRSNPEIELLKASLHKKV